MTGKKIHYGNTEIDESLAGGVFFYRTFTGTAFGTERTMYLLCHNKEQALPFHYSEQGYHHKY